ncbi:hypothetical protein HYV74_01460 [Candidatus Uhrbacteria bacterium]|nr:hypothetical protein [Candidatus Uhrbacteria bacterium]
MRLLFSLVLVSGLWLLISPFVLSYLGVGRANALLVGLIVTILGVMGVAGTTGK